MGTTHHDLGSLCRLANLDDVGLHPGAGLESLVLGLLGLRQQRLNPTKVEQCVPGVVLLNDPGDDVALTTGVLLVLHLPLGLANALAHDLLGRLGCNAAEVVGGDVEFWSGGFTLLVELLGHHPEFTRLGINDDPCVVLGPRHALVGRLQGIGQGAEQCVDRNPLVGCQRSQRLHHVDVAHDSLTSGSFHTSSSLDVSPEACLRTPAESSPVELADLALPDPDLPGLALGPHSNTLRARSISG